MLAAGRDNVLFTERLPLVFDKPQLASAQTAQATIDLTGNKLFKLAPGVKMADGYPAPAEGQPPIQPAGVARELLGEGSVKAKATITLASLKPPVSLASNVVTILVGPPLLSTLAPRSESSMSVIW